MSSPTAAPEPSIEPLALDRFMPYRLSILTNRISAAIARAYAETFDLTIPEWRVVAVLAGAPGLTAGALAEATAMDKVAISRAVARLKTAGRLTAEPDPNDARRQRLTLTRAGLGVFAQVAPLARDYERRLLAALSPPERAALDALITKLSHAAETL